MIDANDYLFDEDGETLPIITHYANNQIVKYTWNNKHDIEILDTV
jgi:hypothetical protein